jgi:hypothetical protein
VGSQTIGGATRRSATVPTQRTPMPPSHARVPGSRPEPEDQARPASGRLAGLCTWAALLGFVGVAVGGRGLVAILVKAPQWYESTLIALGLSGIGLTVVAFLTVHFRYVPWLFLMLSSSVLVASIVATIAAT